MGEKTRNNVYTAFVGEAKAYHRLLAFAHKADEEGFDQIAKLFRAVAAAEGVHVERHLRLMGVAMVRGTEENLQSSFDRETTVNQVYYPQFIQEAEEEGERSAALTFSQARDVEEGHASLYKHALNAMLRDESHDYYVCEVCGYVYDPDKGDPDSGIEPGTAFEDLPADWVCPVCGAGKDQFTPES